MAETLRPELFEEDDIQTILTLGDLSVSSEITPEGNTPDGAYDGPPQEGYERYQVTL
jgi:hypothetical protein